MSNQIEQNYLSPLLCSRLPLSVAYLPIAQVVERVRFGIPYGASLALASASLVSSQPTDYSITY